MAEVKIVEEVIPPPLKVILEMSIDEARVVRALTNRVRLFPINDSFDAALRVWDALFYAGVPLGPYVSDKAIAPLNG